MTNQETKAHDPYAALRLKNFTLFVTARFFLTLAIQIQSIVIGWQIYQITKDPLSLGLIGLTEAVPFISMALFAGHVADIFSRKKIILIATAALVISTTGLFAFTFDNSAFINLHGTAPIYAVVFATGIARAFIGPSFFAFLSQLVPRELYTNAATWNSTIWQVGAVSGPALGGLLYGYLGVTYTYAIDILLILISLFFFILITPQPLPKNERKEKILNSVADGIRFVLKNQVLLAAMSLDLFAVLFGGAVALLPMFADQVLHTGPEGLGLLRSAPAMGAVAVALFLAHFPMDINAGKKLLACVGCFGLCMIGFALSTNFYLSMCFLVLSGAFDNVSVVIRSTILQLSTPDSMRGRVSAVNSIFIGSSNEIGEFESGVAAKLMKLVPSVVFGGCMTLLVVGLTSRFAPRLRNLDLKHLKEHHA